MKLKKRSSGYVDSGYRSAKDELEKVKKKGFCMICQKPLIKRDKNSGRKYHYDCWEKWYSQFAPPISWGIFKYKALERDKYTCVICGKREGESTGEKFPYPTSVTLVVDHIKPIALGGEEFDMNNLQTLCTKCNKKKTFYDMKTIALARKLSEDQKTLLGDSCVWANTLRKENTIKKKLNSV
jgi:5-methylcytosine-specific restriction endonuclease McrA